MSEAERTGLVSCLGTETFCPGSHTHAQKIQAKIKTGQLGIILNGLIFSWVEDENGVYSPKDVCWI